LEGLPIAFKEAFTAGLQRTAWSPEDVTIIRLGLAAQLVRQERSDATGREQ